MSKIPAFQNPYNLDGENLTYTYHGNVVTNIGIVIRMIKIEAIVTNNFDLTFNEEIN